MRMLIHVVDVSAVAMQDFLAESRLLLLLKKRHPKSNRLPFVDA